MNSVIINAEITEYRGAYDDGTVHIFTAIHTMPNGQGFRFTLLTDGIKGPRLRAVIPIAKNVEISGRLDAIAVVAEGVKLVLPNPSGADGDPVTIPL